MFTCENCGKEYLSSDRYNSHVRRCSLRTGLASDAVSSIGSMYSVSSRGSTTSRQHEKILRDKTKLKSEVELCYSNIRKSKKTIEDQREMIEALENENTHRQTRILTLERDLIKYRQDLKKVTTEINKSVEDSNKVLELETKLHAKTNEANMLKQTIDINRSKFIGRLNTLTKDNNRVVEMEKILIGKDEELKKLNAELTANRNQFLQQLNIQKRVTPLERQRLAELEKILQTKDEEALGLKQAMTRMEEGLRKLRDEYVNVKMESVKKEEELQKKMEEAATSIENSSKVEERMKKIRDDCLVTVRKQNVEVQRLKDENSELSYMLKFTESELKTRDNELKSVADSQTQFRQSYVDNLNRQKEMMKEKELLIESRDKRISDLENKILILSTKAEYTTQPKPNSVGSIRVTDEGMTMIKVRALGNTISDDAGIKVVKIGEVQNEIMSEIKSEVDEETTQDKEAESENSKEDHEGSEGNDGFSTKKKKRKKKKKKSNSILN